MKKTKTPQRKSVETKRAAFVRLGNGRLEQALNAIRLIGNLSNTNDYEFTEDDVSKITSEIRQELAATEARFKVSLQRKTRGPVKLAA